MKDSKLCSKDKTCDAMCNVYFNIVLAFKYLENSSTIVMVHNKGGHTCRNKEPKTIEAMIERAATQALVCLN